MKVSSGGRKDFYDDRSGGCGGGRNCTLHEHADFEGGNRSLGQGKGNGRGRMRSKAAGIMIEMEAVLG